MEQFISTLIFTLPGLLCYYWLLWFGITPAQKHNAFEMLGISALLWIPVSVLTLVTYNLIALIGKLPLGKFQYDISYISNVDELKVSIQNFWFILFFIVASILYSYLFSRLWSGKLHQKLIDHINRVREKRGISPFSKNPTVWEEIFIKHGAKVLEISKLDKQDEKIIGSLRKVSRPLEPERNVVIDDVDFFTKLVERYNPAVEHVFIDTKSGLIIKVFNPKDIEEAQYKDLESEDPII